MTARDPLPLTVVGGFLGAGKTTLLNRWLREAQGRRLAVLVNDFGAINVDAELIESTSADLVALTNGCVCCQIGDDLTAALIRVLESPRPFDAVVVEASGVSDPGRIAQIGRADPALTLEAVIVLVDAAAALEQSRDPQLADTLERQLRAADLIVVNKTDLVDAGSLARLHAWLGSIAKGTPHVDVVDAAVPMPSLDELAASGDRAVAKEPRDARRGVEAHAAADEAPRQHQDRDAHALDHDHDHDHDRPHVGVAAGPAADGAVPAHGAMFETWSARPDRAYAKAALQAWLAAMPDGVLRLKGLVRSDDGRWWLLQYAGRRGSVRPAAHAPDAAAVVAIGLRSRLPVSALADFFGDEAGPRAA